MPGVPPHRPGTRCDSAFNVPSANGDLKMKQHTKVPIEGVGVVHVITKPRDNSEDAETDVMLSRYNGGTPLECTYLTGSITERGAALEMHKHWCDLERRIKCVQGDREALHLLDIDHSPSAANSTSAGSTRQFEDCRHNVTWSGWYLREENENTRKHRSTFTATRHKVLRPPYVVYFETN
jgi:hypothetical protein